MVVFIRGNGQLELNRQPLIDAEPAIEFKAVAQVIDIARGAGVSSVGLMPSAR